MNAVRDKFSEASKDHHRIAIYGLGGVGKTQFALEYLYRFRNDYDYCFWVNGAERTSFISELGLVAQNLNITPSRQELTPQEMASELLQCLQQIPRWLLVIDNLDDMKVLQNLVPSGTTTGHILITTRSAHLRVLPAFTLELPVLSSDEAAQLLVRRADLDNPEQNVPPDILSEAKRIVQDLGYLPLAIEQAAGFIRESPFGIAEFHSIYQSNQKDILKQPVGSLDYQESVSTTWLLSFKSLQNSNPDALRLLTLFAFLSPDQILVDFLQAGKEGLGAQLKDLIADPCLLHEMLTSLSNFSLIQRFQQNKSIAIHRLVQAVIKNGLDDTEKRQWRKITLSLSATAFPPVLQKDILLHRRFRNQIMACVEDPEMDKSILMADLLSRTGWYLDVEAQFDAAKPLYERAIQLYREIEGDDSKHLLINMDRLAWNYMKQGLLKEAVDMFKQAFSSMKAVLGEDHDDTLACQRNYGVALLKDGRNEEGILILEQACAKQRASLGDNNPRTHSTMRKLALVYMEQGKLDEAITLLEIVYSSSQSDPRGTFNSVQRDLGWAYCQKNKLLDGVSLLENSYKQQTRALGEENIDTSRTARYLACAYVLQGRVAEGVDLLEQAWSIQKRKLGEEHEETMLSLRYLIAVYEDERMTIDATYREAGEILKRRGLKPISLTR
jgi:tetratricopeptide (TPR) repeat protein